ncbi:hypothetical protein ABW19_dt0201747 [Dactylella cylindrospora]|nr:hypothetical protein ABW19_dt0201747 [Dactylella cylindrospora]
MTRPTHYPLITFQIALAVLPLLFLPQLALGEDLTDVVPTLTHLGSLAPFTPPADCFSASVWTTNRFYDDRSTSGVFQSRFFTRWYFGCNIDGDTGEYNTCCPPNFNTWGFYAPGACPQGYSTMLSGAINPWVGDVRGTVCCPSIKSPSGKTLGGNGFATSYINPLDRDPISISCFEWEDDTTTSDTVYMANLNARALIVFGEELTGVTFAELTQDTSSRRATSSTPRSSSTSSSESESESETSTSESESSPSPGSTSSPGASETDSESRVKSSSSSSGSPSETSQLIGENQSGGKSGLSGGAIAGIAIGVSLPVIGIAVFVAYRLGSRKHRAEMPTVPIYNDPTDKTDGFGGIEGQRW